ncbi:MFS transporter [Marinobacter oulmenensis]|uniref:MFS family permease n=1 Tax=Marinobacter oulmenensis TaxID=643747 RepID=A0A840UC32_9GAMM|nr:MFS transporter [Marinobacter oulmenensis]MBB5321753.1 MFS family permease [Marinobacter oulmenensis]
MTEPVEARHPAVVARSPAVSPDIVVLIAGITAALHVGKLPPAIPALQQALGISLVQSGFLLSLVQLAGMLGGLMISLLADSAGLRRSIMAGLGLLTVASLAGGWAQSGEALLWLRALEGLGFLLVTLSAPALIRQLVAPENLSLRLGWWSCYMGLGMGSALLLAPWILDTLGWQAWWWLLAALTAVVLGTVWRSVPADSTHQSGVRPALGHMLARLWTTLSHSGPWYLGITFAMYAGQWLSVVGFLPSIYTQAGISGTRLGVLTALVALVNAAGNAVAGRLMHRGIPPIHLLTTGFLCMALCAFLAFSNWTGSPVLKYLAVLMFSGIGGIVPASLFALSVQVAPDRHTIPTTVGWMLQFSALGQFVAPPAFATLVAWAGGWQWSWTLSLVTSAAGLGFALLTVRKTATH